MSSEFSEKLLTLEKKLQKLAPLEPPKHLRTLCLPKKQQNIAWSKHWLVAAILLICVGLWSVYENARLAETSYKRINISKRTVIHESYPTTQIIINRNNVKTLGSRKVLFY